MTTLVLGIVVFLGIHVLRWTPVRDPLAERFGEGPWKGIFSVIALAGLGVMIWGLVMTRSGPDAARIVFNPPSWGRHATMALVLLGFISLAISFHKGRLRQILKHPMSIGFALWALGHIISNGNLSEILFFGTFLVLALLDIIVSTARGKVAVFVPKPNHDLISIAAGLVLFFVFLWLHPMLFGVAIV